MTTGRGMRTSYLTSPEDTDEQRRATAKASIAQLESAATVEEPPEEEELVGEELYPEDYAAIAAKKELTIMKGLRMARTATYDLSLLSKEAAEDLGGRGMSNPITAVLGIGTGIGLPEGVETFALLLERVADRLRRGEDLEATSLKAP